MFARCWICTPRVCAGLAVAGHDSGVFGTVWFGYLVMLVALTFIFVGVKRYRDVERGGGIKFLPASTCFR